MFVSCDPDSADDNVKRDLRVAFAASSRQAEKAEPLDWEYNKNPAHWLIDGAEVEYDWIKESYPPLLKAYPPNTDNIID